LRRPEKHSGLKQNLINLRFTYRKTPVTLLDSLTFKNHRKATLEVYKKLGLRECLLLQTCNRVEFYAVTDREPEGVKRAIVEYWFRETHVPKTEFQNRLEESSDGEALGHLLRLTAGLESMLIGEDQVLGQIRGSFGRAKSWGVIGPLLEVIFTKAIRSGGKIRAQTGINRGAVSLGSAAVDMIERTISGLGGRKVMIIGAGETGTLVGKALAARGHRAIYVANRTFNRAARLANLLGGKAVRYAKIGEVLPIVDIVFVATSAPHVTLKKEQVIRAMEKRKGKSLLVFDLSQPRNVEQEIASLKGVRLLDIDILQGVAEENMQARLKEIENAERLVEDELRSLEATLRRRRCEPTISEIYRWAEDIRRREFRRACRLLGEIDKSQRTVVEKLTRAIVEKILHNPVTNLRRAAENGDAELYKVACTLFGLKDEGD